MKDSAGRVSVSDDATVLAVSIGERHLAIGDRRDAMVGDRHAVGVAGEVVEDGRGSAERRLRIDDPGLATQGAEPRPKRRRRLDGRRATPGRPDAAARHAISSRVRNRWREGPRQGADGKEKRRAGGDPAVAVDVEGATGDDAVQVDVEAELLIPRVEDREKAQLAAQMMARIGAEGEERVGDRLEEDLIEDTPCWRG